MIPKIIHFSWISNDPYPPIIQQCMASWKKHLPDYQIMHWGKDEFDIQGNRFTREAYAAKKWAFVSDVQRLYALYHYGGVYLDSDEEIVKNLDVFLKYPAFVGFESDNFLNATLIGAEKGHPWIKRLLLYYENRPFLLENGKFNMEPNSSINTKISCHEFGLILNNKEQDIETGVHVFPKEFFVPNKLGTTFQLTKNTHAIHHGEGTWKSPYARRLERILPHVQSFFKTCRLMPLYRALKYVLKPFRSRF